MTGGLIAFREACEACGITSATLRRWLEEDGVPRHRVEGGVYLHWIDLNKCLVRRGLPIPPVLKKGPKILLVDDDPDVLLVMVDSLQAVWDKAQIATATNGHTAFKKLIEIRPDLLVTDLEMPILRGTELCRWARQDSDLSAIKILAVTGYDSPAQRALVREGAADGYLVKPFAPEEFREAAAGLLGAVSSLKAGAIGTI